MRNEFWLINKITEGSEINISLSSKGGNMNFYKNDKLEMQ